MLKPNLIKILVMRHYLVSLYPTCKEDDTRRAYLNAYLLSNFGIVVDKPHLLSDEMIKDIQQVYKLNVPKSFYDNPQDTKYYTRGQLLMEQLVSYFLVETGTGIYDRVELFKKHLPEYVVGDEIKLRKFQILSVDEANEVLKEIATSLCAYTRPFSLEEMEDFKTLYSNGYVSDDVTIGCKDNIINMLDFDINLAKFLDKKDLVKLSIQYVGEKKVGVREQLDKLNDRQTNIIRKSLGLVRNCPLTKKQAKYYNKLVQVYGGKVVEANSPHKLAIKYFKEGNVVEAARVYSKSGSLLERNLRMLLSRANPQEALEIMNMIKVKNPMVLFQLVSSLKEEGIYPRTFSFYKNNLVKKHVETEYETKWRKSRLNESTNKFLHDACLEKVFDYYRGLPSLGKVYISDAFYRLGVPSNTSASGKGIDVLPTGSRLPIQGSAIRTFVTWKGVYDIDASITLIGDEKKDYLYFGNYSSKPFGNDILFSGDCRGSSGTEYYDIKLERARVRGYKYLVFSFHGYNGRLDEGEIVCGYQDKTDLNTKAWDAKNIGFQFNVKGDTRACLGFAIDLTTNEMVVLNLMVDDESRVVHSGTSDDMVNKFLSPSFLEINMGDIIACRGEVVSDPCEADVVFDDSFMPEMTKDGTPAQKVIRTFDLEKLVSISSEKQ